MEGYATGHALAEVGVISGRDLTCEATLAKLHFLLSQPISHAKRIEWMQQPLRGEMRDHP